MTDRANSGNGPVRPRFGGFARRRPEVEEARPQKQIRGPQPVVRDRKSTEDEASESGPQGADSAESGRRRSQSLGRDAVDPAPKLAALFLIALVVPVALPLGGLNLSPHRLLAIAVLVPLFFRWISGAFGGVKRADVCLLLFCVWVAPVMVYNHGIATSWQFIGMNLIETMGPFLIGRALIRSPDSFRFWLKILAAILVVLAPFLAFEALTGVRLLGQTLGTFQHSIGTSETRWGMDRAAGPFDHPILAGVFGAACLALFINSLATVGKTAPGGGRKGFPKFLAIAASIGVTFFSLSLGAFITAALQGGLVVYDRITRGMKDRWKTLAVGFSAVYLFLLMASNRGPILIFIQTFAFNSFSASIRLQTWNYGTDVIWNNPLFGIGLHDWPRPPWLTGSVDNYWLLHGMRYGYPGMGLMIGAFAFTVIPLLKARYDDPDLDAIRKGYLMTLIAMMMAMCTVHLWGTVYAFVMFLLGAGAWLIDRDLAAPAGKHRRR